MERERQQGGQQGGIGQERPGQERAGQSTQYQPERQQEERQGQTNRPGEQDKMGRPAEKGTEKQRTQNR